MLLTKRIGDRILEWIFRVEMLAKFICGESGGPIAMAKCREIVGSDKGGKSVCWREGFGAQSEERIGGIPAAYRVRADQLGCPV